MGEDLSKLTTNIRSLVRQGKFSITYHVLNDHPERNISAVDILECLKIGSVASAEPKEIDGKEQYTGDQRYRWFGEDESDRVLRLILVVEADVIVVSAAEATSGQAERYRKEDSEES
jgi:hypothetical protein